MCFFIDYKYLSEIQKNEIDQLKQQIAYLKREDKTDKEILKNIFEESEEIDIEDIEEDGYNRLLIKLDDYIVFIFDHWGHLINIDIEH